jgi:hypothetical protein
VGSVIRTKSAQDDVSTIVIVSGAAVVNSDTPRCNVHTIDSNRMTNTAAILAQ